MRTNIEEADKILGKKFKVLNHGYVSLVDYCGGDQMIESFARVSYGAGTRPVSDTRKLIRYLVGHEHTSPLESTELSFSISMPIHVMRQFIRHRTFSVNEYSARYSELPEILYEDYNFNLQSKNNKQGRSEDQAESDELTQEIKEHHKKGFELYNKLLEKGVAREISRMHLPLNAYTYFFCKVDLNNLFRFLKLRLDLHAQYEIRCYAHIMACFAKLVAPIAFEAWYDYKYMGRNFSSEELNCVKNVFEYANDEFFDVEPSIEYFIKNTRDRTEFNNKLKVENPYSFDINTLTEVN